MYLKIGLRKNKIIERSPIVKCRSFTFQNMYVNAKAEHCRVQIPQNYSIFLVSQIWKIAAWLGLTNTIYLNKKAVRQRNPSVGNEINCDGYGT